MSALDEHYQKVLGMKAPIQGHLETLRSLASRCNHVTEFGAGLSTVALLAGRPKILISYDALQHKDVLYLSGLAETPFLFIQADTLNVMIEQTDMLFIDTKHTAEQVYTELFHNGRMVKRYLVFHDTVSCGEYDYAWPGPPLGILWGIGRYMLENMNAWCMIENYKHSNGLMIFERQL